MRREGQRGGEKDRGERRKTETRGGGQRRGKKDRKDEKRTDTVQYM